MIDTLQVYEELSQALAPDAARRLTTVLGRVFDNLEQTVTKREFGDLHAVVQRLADADDRLGSRMEELAQAQKRTELRVEELVEAQKRTGLRIEELVEAQKRTDLRLDQLTQAQLQTEERLARLAMAQEQLAAALNQLITRVDRLEERLDDTNRQLGGLAMTVGYTLENQAYRALPALLSRDHGLVIEGRLTRDYLNDADGNPREVNILGQAIADGGGRRTILGESKSQLSANDIDRFLRRLVEPLSTGRNPFPLLVTHMITHPSVRQHARDKGVALYFSYDFDPS